MIIFGFLNESITVFSTMSDGVTVGAEENALVQFRN